MEIFSDEYFMKSAYREAETAYGEGEIPIGAVVVCQNRIIARAHNLTERLNDVTAHAEMQAITAAANLLGGKYLTGCTLFVTIEPCTMCAGALSWAQIDRLVYGQMMIREASQSMHPTLFIQKQKFAEGCFRMNAGF